jgi:predicted  nucleic acid-binding Zn-ribbon protein
MSTIAKVFTGLNLILAALFLGWAASALSANAGYRSQYDKEVSAHQSSKTQLESELSKLRTEKQEADSKASRFMAERDDAAARADRTKQDLDTEVRKNAEMRADLSKIAATLDEIENSKNKLQADKDRAVQATNEAEKAKTAAEIAMRAAEEKLADAEGELRTAKNSIADLEKVRTSLEKEKKTLSTRLDTVVGQTGINLSDVAAMPLIEGRVVEVSATPAPGIVQLNVGQSHGVEVGFTFEVFNGDDYKGKVRVTRVHPSSSTAVIHRTVQGQKINQGDSAATRL